MEITNKDLKRRILTISHEHGLSHLGSCLTAVDIIEEIYQTKKRDEKFVLSAGHAGLALYVVLEKHYGYNAEELFQQSGVHPDRLATRRFIEGTADGYEYPIDCSTGSLGQGISIATGMAIANRDKKVYTLLTDGEMNEGSCYEALEVAHELGLGNLEVYINCNGFGAYKELSRDHIIDRCRGFTNVNIHFVQTDVSDFPFLQGLKGHYVTLSESDYEHANNILREEQAGAVH
jgi:transketolase